MVFRKYCGDGSLGRADRFDCLRLDGWAFYSVAGKRFGDELNQTIHRGSWHRIKAGRIELQTLRQVLV